AQSSEPSLLGFLNTTACADPCIAKADFWPCNDDDTACICLNAKFYEEIATCIDGACSPEETNAAAETFGKYCKAAVRHSSPVHTRSATDPA
ncbi:hypothetical protein M407DRAFT_61522, partial [Tulasnella calospora MUT 4182]